MTRHLFTQIISSLVTHIGCGHGYWGGSKSNLLCILTPATKPIGDASFMSDDNYKQFCAKRPDQLRGCKE